MTAADRIVRAVVHRASRPVDGASLAVFRILFGVLATVGAVRILAMGWISPMYLEPGYHFTYPGFGWVAPWPGVGLYVHMAVLALLGVAIAIGWRTRTALTLYLVGFLYVELLDRTYYLNHYYWVSVAALVLLLLPIARVWSLDARRQADTGDSVPAWTVWTLRGLVGVVYVFAGVSKLNPDWLQGMPLRIWLPHDAGLPLVGPLLAEPAVAVAVSWITLVFELIVVPALLWRRTRPFAYATVAAFHLGTWIVLPEIGLFPFIMMAGALVFFEPDWPRRLLGRLGVHRPRRVGTVPATPRWVPVTVAVIAVVQLLLPVRSALYPGDVRWTEEGYRFSWRVMLTEKVGHARFTVVDPATDRRWTVDPATVLSPPQERAMAVQPDMILDTAHLLRDRYRQQGVMSPRVYADVMVAMNGRPARRLIDPTADLASVGHALGTKPWVIRPADEPTVADARTG